VVLSLSLYSADKPKCKRSGLASNAIIMVCYYKPKYNYYPFRGVTIIAAKASYSLWDASVELPWSNCWWS